MNKFESPCATKLTMDLTANVVKDTVVTKKLKFAGREILLVLLTIAGRWCPQEKPASREVALVFGEQETS